MLSVNVPVRSGQFSQLAENAHEAGRPVWQEVQLAYMSYLESTIPVYRSDITHCISELSNCLDSSSVKPVTSVRSSFISTFGEGLPEQIEISMNEIHLRQFQLLAMVLEDTVEELIAGAISQYLNDMLLKKSSRPRRSRGIAN